MSDNEKVSKLTKARKRLVRFVKEIRNELKKVIWPTKEQLINNTITVLLACFVVGALIWIVDFALANIVGAVLLR